MISIKNKQILSKIIILSNYGEFISYIQRIKSNNSNLKLSNIKVNIYLLYFINN